MKIQIFLSVAMLLGVAQQVEARSIKSSGSIACWMSVHKAVEVVPENEQQKLPVEARTTRLVEVNLNAQGDGDQEFVVNGETLAVRLDKFEFADLYQMGIYLTTPASELPPKGPAFLALISDRLVNSGPFKDDGFSPNPTGKGTTRFEFLDLKTGSIGLTTKFVNALKADGGWGKHPFDRLFFNAAYGSQVFDAARDLVARKKLKPSDIIAISTVFNCTLSK